MMQNVVYSNTYLIKKYNWCKAYQFLKKISTVNGLSSYTYLIHCGSRTEVTMTMTTTVPPKAHFIGKSTNIPNSSYIRFLMIEKSDQYIYFIEL